jgi:hypothetical protein
MRSLSLGLAVAALVTPATPLLATQGMDCVSRQRGAPTLYMSIGSGGGVDLIVIGDRGREVRVEGVAGANPRLLRESHMDRRGRMRVRIVSGDGRTLLGRVVLTGTGADVFHYRGRTWPIRCRWEPQG